MGQDYSVFLDRPQLHFIRVKDRIREHFSPLLGIPLRHHPSLDLPLVFRIFGLEDFLPILHHFLVLRTLIVGRTCVIVNSNSLVFAIFNPSAKLLLVLVVD